MKKVNWREINIQPHHIVTADTTPPDYEMSRRILLELSYDEYVILEGHHCSCYDFDDTEWEAIEYTRDELKKLSNASYNIDDNFWKDISIHIG